MDTKRHQYTMVGEAGAYHVEVSPTTGYGWFEHGKTGSGGGLWFDGSELVDYDGVYALPRVVGDWLREKGFDVGEENH